MPSGVLFWLAALLVVASFALTFGLTYLPSYSAIRVEDHFPVQVRIHVLYYYIFLILTTFLLVLRKKVSKIHTLSEQLISTKTIPYTSTRLSVGGTFITFWVLLMIGLPQAYWWNPEKDFYRQRGIRDSQTTKGTTKLAVIGTTGHVVDILIGLVVLPVSRDAALGRVLDLETFTLLRFHKLVAYGLFLMSFVHGIIFYTWIPDFATEESIRDAVSIDNPAIGPGDRHWNGNAYFTSTVVGTGVIAFLIMLAIIITSLPKARRKSYNIFYFVHLLSIIIFILVCLHASTDFYMLLPGLCLWLLDWVTRLRGLGTKVEAQLQNEGNGWYRIVVPITSKILVKRIENTTEWPLKSFYLNIPQISKAQNHAFTTTSALTASSKEVVFLWRVPNLGKSQKKLDKEWTVKLSKLVNEIEDLEHAASSEISYGQTRAISVRMEGPYITPHTPFDKNDSVLCIVGGTGISGAISLAERFQAGPDSPIVRFGIMWSLKEDETMQLIELEKLKNHPKPVQISTHLTGPGRTRIDFEKVIRDWQQLRKVEGDVVGNGKTWIYFSGPDGFMNSGESACVKWNKAVSEEREKLEWYCARWDV